MLSVLLVDDDPMVLEATRLFLVRFGEMNVTTAPSATSALAILSEQSFDAIVVDYDMPDINGIELLKIIRTKGDTTPVIVFTGVGREHAAIEALNNGADFFIQKGDEPATQLRNMVHRIRQAVEKRFVGTGLGTTQKVLIDTVNFFPLPAFVLDRDGKVIAWNGSMESFTGLAAVDILGKSDREYATSLLGRKAPLPTELLFRSDENVEKYQYKEVFRDRSTLIAWTRAVNRDGGDYVLWMKATALFDSRGSFVAVIGTVRDITGELGPELLRQSAVSAINPVAAPASQSQGSSGMFGKLLGKAKSLHKEGLRIYYRENKPADAIPLFDSAIGIDPSLAFAWNDRGLCYRETGRDDDALQNFDKAAELDPQNEEILYNQAETLKRIGLLRAQPRVIENAIRAYNRVLELNPNNADAWNGLGVCVKETGKAELSRQYFDRARELRRANKDKKNVRNIDLLV